jgi:large subunit ribosomal protein L4
MSASTLTPDSAKQASINLVEDQSKGMQALHETVVAYKANRRQGNACTKSRAEVAGSGKKLWRQKGTGRARMGSVRSPIWRGGGIVWGPKPRDYSKKVLPKVKTLAFRKALTLRIEDGDVLVTSRLSIADGKTKSFVKTIGALTDANKVLVLGEKFDEATYRSARNVQNIQLFPASDVTAEQLLNYQKIIIVGDALETLARRTAA